MQSRATYGKAAPDVFQGMLALSAVVQKSRLAPGLVDLVYYRVSQMNGCAYCLDMHWKDLRALGENEQRLYSLDAWRECPYYSDRERAALEWTEAVTLVANTHVPDSAYQAARAQLSEKELAELAIAIGLINTWNRIAIAFRRGPAPRSHAA